MIASISGAPGEYGVDENKLRPFDRLLQSLEGKLMEGKIFEVRERERERVTTFIVISPPSPSPPTHSSRHVSCRYLTFGRSV